MRRREEEERKLVNGSKTKKGEMNEDTKEQHYFCGQRHSVKPTVVHRQSGPHDNWPGFRYLHLKQQHTLIINRLKIKSSTLKQTQTLRMY